MFLTSAVGTWTVARTSYIVHKLQWFIYLDIDKSAIKHFIFVISLRGRPMRKLFSSLLTNVKLYLLITAQMQSKKEKKEITIGDMQRRGPEVQTIDCSRIKRRKKRSRQQISDHKFNYDSNEMKWTFCLFVNTIEMWLSMDTDGGGIRSNEFKYQFTSIWFFFFIIYDLCSIPSNSM